jgi:hypothetical protein
VETPGGVAAEPTGYIISSRISVEKLITAAIFQSRSMVT